MKALCSYKKQARTVALRDGGGGTEALGDTHTQQAKRQASKQSDMHRKSLARDGVRQAQHVAGYARCTRDGVRQAQHVAGYARCTRDGVRQAQHVTGYARCDTK